MTVTRISATYSHKAVPQCTAYLDHVCGLSHILTQSHSILYCSPSPWLGFLRHFSPHWKPALPLPSMPVERWHGLCRWCDTGGTETNGNPLALTATLQQQQHRQQPCSNADSNSNPIATKTATATQPCSNSNPTATQTATATLQQPRQQQQP